MRGASLGWAALSVLGLLSWQALTVHYSFGGNWTALFCTGENLPIPPDLASEDIYRFAKSNGWDGQFYHYIAHDPLLRHGLWKYVDAPRLRYRRILVPATAFLLAGGRPQYVDRAYRLVILLFFLAGAYWLGRIAELQGRSSAWALAFLLLPASIVSADRMAVDVALAAVCAGFALYAVSDRKAGVVYLILVLAALVRDTGMLLAGGYCLWLLQQKRIARAFLFATAVIPALAWYLFVRMRTEPYVFDAAFAIPFTGVLDRVLHPMKYPFSPALNALIMGLDFLGIAGVVLALGLGIRIALRGRLSAIGWTMVLFTLLGLFVWRPGDWLEAYDYGRILTPLALLMAIDAFVSRQWIGVAPLCMLLPRCGLQMGSQALSVCKGLAAGLRI